MLKKRARLAAVVAGAALVAFGCSSSLDPIEEPKPEALSGRLAQGYVANAIVLADKLLPGQVVGDYIKNAGEVSVTSDANGNFAMDLPAGYGEYVLYSRGGTIASTGEPASPMLAPKGAKNITPVTTLVALQPELKSVIGDDLFDADIADTAGVDGGLLQLAKSVEAVTAALSDPDVGVLDSAESMILSVGKIATELVEQNEKGNFDSLSDLEDSAGAGTVLEAAVNEGVKAILADDKIVSENAEVTDANAVAASVQEVVKTVQEEVPAGETVKETAVEDKINDAIEEQVEDEISGVVKNVAIKLGDVTLMFDSASDLVIKGTDGVYNLTTPIKEMDAETINAFSLMLMPENDFDSTKNFDDARLVLTLSDKDSSRTATIVVTNVDVSVTYESALSLKFDTATKVRVDGVNSNGVIVTGEFENKDDDQAIVSYDANKVTVNLDNLEEAIKAKDPNSDLVDVGVVGNYIFNFSAEDVPLQAGSGSFEVE